MFWLMMPYMQITFWRNCQIIWNKVTEGANTYPDTGLKLQTIHTALVCNTHGESDPVEIFPKKWEQEVKVIWQKAPQGGTIPQLGVTPGGRKLYHWIPGVGFPISVP